MTPRETSSLGTFLDLGQQGDLKLTSEKVARQENTTQVGSLP